MINWEVIVSNDHYLRHLFIFKKIYKNYKININKIDKKEKLIRDLKIKLIGFKKVLNKNKSFFYTDIDIFISNEILQKIFKFINLNQDKNFFLNTLKYDSNNRIPCSLFYIHEIPKFKNFLNKALKQSINDIQKSYSEKFLQTEIFLNNSIDLFELLKISYIIIEKPYRLNKEKEIIYKNFFNEKEYHFFKKNYYLYNESNIAFIIENFSNERIIRIS